MSNDQTDLKEVSKKKGSTFQRLKVIIEKLEETGRSYSIDELAEMFGVTQTTMSNYMVALLRHFPFHKKKSNKNDQIKYAINIRRFISIRSNLEEMLEKAVREIDRNPLGPGKTGETKRQKKNDRVQAVLKKLTQRPYTISELEGELKDIFAMSRKSVERDIRSVRQSFPVQIDQDDLGCTRYFVDRRTILRARINEQQQFALAFAYMASPFGSSFQKILDKISEEVLRPAQPSLDVNLMNMFVFTTAGDDSAENLYNKLLTLAEACYRKKCVKITYRTLATRITDQRNRSEINDRVIEPAYLFPAMDGLFYVMAFCQMRNDWRIFAVDQLLTCESTYEEATEELSQDKRNEVSKGFGPFLGDKVEEFIIRFSPQIRPYIERRKWHISDTPETKKPVYDEVFGESSLELRLTTTGGEGVKHWLKQWMPDFRVIKPSWLKNELEEEINKQLEHFQRTGELQH